jgi:hypothetical protein
MSETIEINFVSTNVITRWPCHVFGGHTEKVGTLCEEIDARDGAEVRVCERCLEAGSLGQRLEETARMFEDLANRTRGMIGRLKTPTYAAWPEADIRRAEQRREDRGFQFIDLCDTARALLDDGIDLDDRAAVEAALINPYKGSRCSAAYADASNEAAKFTKAHPAEIDELPF